MKFLTRVLLLTMLCVTSSSVGLANAEGMIPDPNPDWTFEEHLEWSEKYFDFWAEQQRTIHN